MNPRFDHLAKKQVHIAGAGRLGTNIALALEEAGVGHVSINDPQRFEREQLAVCGFSRVSDLGRAKVEVLARYLEGRPNCVLTPIVARNQADELIPYFQLADVLVSCANRLDARIHMERMAVHFRKPCIQVCVQDGREAHGGSVSVWTPHSEGACFACLFSKSDRRFPRQHAILLPTVTKTVASFAADRIARVLSEPAARNNLFVIDLCASTIEPLSVRRRPNCRICGDERVCRK